MQLSGAVISRDYRNQKWNGARGTQVRNWVNTLILSAPAFFHFSSRWQKQRLLNDTCYRAPLKYSPGPNERTTIAPSPNWKEKTVHRTRIINGIAQPGEANDYNHRKNIRVMQWNWRICKKRLQWGKFIRNAVKFVVRIWTNRLLVQNTIEL